MLQPENYSYCLVNDTKRDTNHSILKLNPALFVCPSKQTKACGSPEDALAR